MKKVLLITFAMVFTIATQAQMSSDVRKQTGGESNLEMMLAPLGSNPLSISGIKFRKFTSATTAWRVTAFVGFTTDKSVDNNQTPINNADNNEQINPTITMNEFNISLAPGIEKHFAGTDRLSPYTGAEVVLGFMSSSEQYQQPNDDNDDFEDGQKVKNGSFSAGANVFGGVDYYIAHHLYVGAELGFGLLFTTDFDQKTEPADGDEFTSGPQGSSLGVGPNYVAKIRVGWLFVKS